MNTLQGTVSKIKGPGNKLSVLSSPNINQKTPLFCYLLQNILKMYFFLYYVYLITYLQALVGAHCSIYTFMIFKIYFYLVLVCLFEEKTRSPN